MLKLFAGAKSDHPLADLREAKRVLAQLPAVDAEQALGEITHWLESVRN